jgi:hypothetical protein
LAHSSFDTTLTPNRLRVASDENPKALGGEEPDGQARQSKSTPGFGAETTAPELRRNQRQLLISPIVVIKVRDFFGLKLNNGFTAVNCQRLPVFFWDHQSAFLVNFFTEFDGLPIIVQAHGLFTITSW